MKKQKPGAQTYEFLERLQRLEARRTQMVKRKESRSSRDQSCHVSSWCVFCEEHTRRRGSECKSALKILGQWSQETAEEEWEGIWTRKGSHEMVHCQACHRRRRQGLIPGGYLNMHTWVSPSQAIRGLGHPYRNFWKSLVEGCAH